MEKLLQEVRDCFLRGLMPYEHELIRIEDDGRVLYSGKRVASVGLTDDGRLLIDWTGGAGQPFPLQPGSGR